MQYFYINQNSTLNTLRVELLEETIDGYKRETFNKAIQNADVTFSMWDECGELKISNAPCFIKEINNHGCESKFIIEYQWKKRDTKTKGVFTGRFKINFKNDIYEDGVEFPIGELVVPINEELKIMVK